MSKYLRIRVRIIFRDNRFVLLALALWFALGFFVYLFSYGLNVPQALRASLFCEKVEGGFAQGYGVWTEGIIFGVVFSLIFQNVLEKYIPERSCRMLAKERRNHVIVVGYSHLGRRLVGFFREQGVSYCLVEKDRQKVDDLLRDGEPVIVDDACDLDALTDANVQGAEVVLITSNNIETSLLVTKRAREHNPECRIIARCFQDEFVEILESLGANDIISSSKNAFDDIVTRVEF